MLQPLDRRQRRNDVADFLRHCGWSLDGARLRRERCSPGLDGSRTAPDAWAAVETHKPGGGDGWSCCYSETPPRGVNGVKAGVAVKIEKGVEPSGGARETADAGPSRRRRRLAGASRPGAANLFRDELGRKRR